MNLDLIIRNARLADMQAGEAYVDIAIHGGKFVLIQPAIAETGLKEIDVKDCLVAPGFVETHIHLDKICTIDRCACETVRFPFDAMERVSAIKNTFTIEDVQTRAKRTLEKCISHGCTLMRTHVEVDPKIGLRGFEGGKSIIDAYKSALDMEICVMPQEGMLNNPRTEELMIAALTNGATVIGAAPNYETDPAAQIRRVFEIAHEFNVDIDMHLDSGASASRLDTLQVCELTEKYN